MPDKDQTQSHAAFDNPLLDALADSPEPAQLVEISGRIKWFDLVKGYGFVVADNGLGDVLLHVTALRKDGHSKACEGARVVCEAMRGTKGWQVFRVISLDAPAPAEKPDLSEEPPRNLSSREEPQVLPLGGFEDVKVKWFNRVKGFGFLSRGDGTEDIFVHMEILRRHGISILHPGEELRARFGQGPKGLIAIEVRPLDAPAPVHH